MLIFMLMMEMKCIIVFDVDYLVLWLVDCSERSKQNEYAINERNIENAVAEMDSK